LGCTGAIYFANFFSKAFAEYSVSIDSISDLVREGKKASGRESGKMRGSLEAVLFEGDDDTLRDGAILGMIPRLAKLHRQSSLALLLRHTVLGIETRGFEGLASSLAGVREEAQELAELSEDLSSAYALGSIEGFGQALQMRLEREEVRESNGRSSREGNDRVDIPPSTLRRTMLDAINVATEGGGRERRPQAGQATGVSAGFAYPHVLSAIHRYFDYGYGMSIGGGSGVTGESDTPMGVLLKGVGGPCVAPSARARELFLSSTSAPPCAANRMTSHHALLTVSRALAVAGRGEEVWTSLLECLRIAQSSGDAPAASYVLETLQELVEQRQPSEEDNDDDVEPNGRAVVAASSIETLQGLSILRRIRVRACELGMWRQQVRISIKLAQRTFKHVAAAAEAATRSIIHASRRATEEGGSSGTPSFPSLPLPLLLPVPFWVSLDCFTSSRVGGMALGASSVSGTGEGGDMSGGGGGGGGTAGIPRGFLSSGAAGVAGLTLPPQAYTPFLTPTPSSSRLPGDSLYLTACTALSSATATAAARGGRLAKLTGGTGAGGMGSAWSSQLPLHWYEVVSFQGEGHKARSEMWGQVSAVCRSGGCGRLKQEQPQQDATDAAGGGKPTAGWADSASLIPGTAGSLLLQAAALRCSAVSRAFSHGRAEEWGELWGGESLRATLKTVMAW